MAGDGQYATLHNADYVAERDIREGDMVTVKRAGEVIPQVLGPVLELRLPEAQPWQVPAHCPSCGEPVERVEGEVAYYCANAACPAQLVRAVEHFVSKGAMDIEGFGIRQAELFVEKGLIHDVADIYHLTAEQLLEMEGFADKKVSNLLAAIEASKQRPADRLLAALGVQGIGGVNAQTLMDHFRSVEALARALPDDLKQIPGVGPKLADSIAGWFSHEPNRRLVDRLKTAGVRTTVEVVQSTGVQELQDLIFVITGTPPSLSREQATEPIQAHGGKVTGAVSGNTDYP